MTEPDTPRLTPRCDPQELLRERHRVLVGEGEQAGTGHALASAGHGAHDRRMAVAEGSRPERGAEIEELPPALLDQAAAVTTDEGEGEKRSLPMFAIARASRSRKVSAGSGGRDIGRLTCR